MLLGLAQGTAGDYGTTSARARQPVDIGSIIKGTAMLTGKGAPSDVRVKENIVRVGTAPNGLGLYEFNYRGDKARWRGVMAQEIPMWMSDAVSVDPDGMMRVRYDKLGMAMERVDAAA